MERCLPQHRGPAEFIYLGFGRGGVAQALNLFQWVAYLLSTALQAAGFAAYASALTGWSHEGPTRAIAAVVVVVFAVANLLGLRALVRWQLFILLIEAVALGFWCSQACCTVSHVPRRGRLPVAWAGSLLGPPSCM